MNGREKELMKNKTNENCLSTSPAYFLLHFNRLDGKESK